jgi:hypothetical protein
MSYRRMWSALPAAALMSVAVLAAGCAASTTAAPGKPAASQSVTGQGGTASGSPPSPTPSGQPGSPPAGQPPSGTPDPAGSDCTNWPSSAPQGPLPVTFVPVEALRCVRGTTTVRGQGVYVSATLQRATQDLGPLVAALRRSSGHALPGMICPALVIPAPQLVLVAADGAMISPRFPVDDCGILQPGVLATLEKLPWQTVSVRLFSRLPDISITATPAGS